MMSDTSARASRFAFALGSFARNGLIGARAGAAPGAAADDAGGVGAAAAAGAGAGGIGGAAVGAVGRGGACGTPPIGGGTVAGLAGGTGPPTVGRA